MVELSFKAQQAIEAGGDAALVMGFIDEQDIGQLADPVGGPFEQLSHMARAAGHRVEQHETTMRPGVGAHHERTEFPAVETQELSSRETERMCERRGHGEIGVGELRDVDDGDVRDLPRGQQLPSEIVLALLPTDEPRRPVLPWSELQRCVLFVRFRQLFRPVFADGQFALGVPAVQTNGEAASSGTSIDDQQLTVFLVASSDSLQSAEVRAFVVETGDGQQFGLADGWCG